jgi:signal transduction histidine kinase
MNKHLQAIADSLQQYDKLTLEQKEQLLKYLKNADKELEIVSFKLDRTEKVKKTTAILLEETIEELEQKRKAVEAQNKDLEIEAALERVRSRSMGMHKSDELKEVIRLVLEQLVHLKINAEHAGFYIDYKAHDDMHIWLADPNIEPFYATIPYFDTPTWNSFLEAKAKGTAFHTDLLDFEEKNRFYKTLFKLFTVPEEAKEFYLRCKGLAVSTVLLDNVGLYIENFSGIPYSDEENKILMRFGKVFQQTYTRFLDLQKAEAQAREAQIEAALERVRSRSIGMHKSSELVEVVELLDKEISGLGIKVETISIITDFSEPQKGANNWTKTENYLDKFHVPFIDHPITTRIYDALATGLDYFSVKISNEEKDKFFRLLYKCSDYRKIPEERKQYIFNAPGWTRAAVISKNSILIFQWFKLKEITKDEEDIFKRFGKVFEQTYTRFLDLQKAEAQTREAQIEAALEKVRSRSLAMHKSEELQNVVNIVFERLNALNIDMNVASVFIFKQGSKDLEQWVASSDTDYSTYFHLPYADNAIFNDLEEARKSGKDFYNATYSKEEKNNWFNYAFTNTDYNRIPEGRKKFLIESEFYKVAFALSKNTGLQLAKYSGNDFSEKDNEILKRFSKVFEQAYVRFLDLQKAEAQARESQIQLALERVRARTMAMHSSVELSEAAVLLFEQLSQLGAKLWICGFCICDSNSEVVEKWMSPPDGKIMDPVYVPYTVESFEQHAYETWKTRGELYHDHQEGFELQKSHEETLLHPSMQQARNHLIEKGITPPESVDRYAAPYKNGYLMIFTTRRFDETEIFARFAKVFEQTYTRFLDLKKAEAQSRESQIQLALERVRARTMAMQHSSEMADASFVLDTQVRALGINTRGCAFNIYGDGESTEWFSSAEGSLPMYKTPRERLFLRYYEAGQRGEQIYIEEFEGDKCKVHYEYLCTIPIMGDALRGMIAAGGSFPTRQIDHVVYFKYGYLLFLTLEPVPEAHEIFKRFAKVFEQTYTRFLDLQKAEVQTRESQIQLALERVRARTMAMQKSEELSETAVLLFHQLMSLELNVKGCGFNIWEKDEKSCTSWMSGPDGELSRPFTLPLAGDPLFIRYYESRQKEEDFFVYETSKDELVNRYNYLSTLPVLGEEITKELKEGKEIPPFVVDHVVNFSKGNLIFITYERCPDEWDIFKRFGKVFEQTYTRFLDLQKAEAQSREAQIELSLERVRAKTMAMHNSADVGDTAATMVEELKKLGIETIRCGIGIMHEPGDMEVWTIKTNQEDKADIIIGWLDMHIHPLLHGAFESWRKKNESYSYELKGEDLFNYYNAINNYPGYPIHYDTNTLPGLIHHNEFTFAEGILFAFSLEQLKEEQRKIFKRFASVFGQTYRRYLDLKNAEALAKEAQVEAGLERVRSRTLAMQKSDELAETAAEVFKQLIGLGMEPNRLYIGIVNGDTRDMEMWATDEDGSGVGKKFVFNAADNTSVKKLYDGWAEKIKSVTVDMQGEELENYINYLRQLKIPLSHALTQKRRVQSVAYFDKGFIGMASPDEQSEDSIHLLERFAAVFNLTFTRFNDLKVAEAHAVQAEQDLIEIKAARKKAEDTLTELQVTQKQLIQSEKMASLGELTAGIAHEIQNPLNFVNNFSEINSELIEEMKLELNKGDINEAKFIAEDIRQNLEKINHHGKRADAIVKGMLQHSQKSSGEKIPTDINALADEFLRLAYHGLRAKDKLFNATLQTDFDKSISTINIIPQDIGRAILNIVTNAFYAVNEKKKQVDKNYQPIVSLITRKLTDAVQISIEDNGAGIPKDIVDKIFQPFFTTKPTGQGTGLGLSLAYDIVKAHGGELSVESRGNVETKENEGTTFIILLKQQA